MQIPFDFQVLQQHEPKPTNLEVSDTEIDKIEFFPMEVALENAIWCTLAWE